MPLDIVCSIYEASRARWLPKSLCTELCARARERDKAACLEHIPPQPHTTPTPDGGFKPETHYLDPTVWDLARARQGSFAVLRLLTEIAPPSCQKS